MNTINPHPIFRFLDLPTEIRLMIYDVIFDNSKLHISHPRPRELHDATPKAPRKPILSSITMVSKNCRAEIFSALARNRTFVFRCPLKSRDYQIPSTYLAQTRKAWVSASKFKTQSLVQMSCLEELTIHWPVYHHGRSHTWCTKGPLPDFKVYYSAPLDATESEIVTGFLNYPTQSGRGCVQEGLEDMAHWLRVATAAQKPRPARIMVLVDVLLVDPRGIQLACVWRDVCVDVETCEIVRSGPKVFCTLDRFNLARNIEAHLYGGLEVGLSTVATRYIDLVRARLGSV